MTSAASAITWHPTKYKDPLTGEKVDGWQWGSYGSYIYQYPSKVDLVYWPLTDERWICVNPKNGYGAFNDDFEELSDDKKKTLSKWLKECWKRRLRQSRKAPNESKRFTSSANTTAGWATERKPKLFSPT